jgi:hypothetical protein
MNDTRQLWQRIADAEWMAKHGYSLDAIIENTKLSRITAHCTVSRVRQTFDDFSALRRNCKDAD